MTIRAPCRACREPNLQVYTTIYTTTLTSVIIKKVDKDDCDRVIDGKVRVLLDSSPDGRPNWRRRKRPHTGDIVLLEKPEFRKKLEVTLHERLTISHPIFKLLLDKQNANLEFLQKTALQGYQLTKHFLEYVENLFFYCPLPRHKRRLLHNMYEEETGRLSNTKNHVKLMQDFIRALGIDDTTREAAKALSATQELIDYRMDAVKDPAKYHIGAAAVTIASEGQNLETLGSESRDVLFKRVYGLQDKDLLFFSVHQKEDVHHVQQGLDLVADLCVDEKMQEEALFAVSHTCQLFYGMYEGIYQAHLAGTL